MITCEENNQNQDIPNMKLTEIAMIDYANGHSWNPAVTVAIKDAIREEKKLELKQSRKTDNLKALMLIGLIAGGILLTLGILAAIFLTPGGFFSVSILTKLLLLLIGFILMITGILIGLYLKKHA